MPTLYATRTGVLTTNPRIARALAEFDAREVSLPLPMLARDVPPPAAPALPARAASEVRV